MIEYSKKKAKNENIKFLVKSVIEIDYKSKFDFTFLAWPDSSLKKSKENFELALEKIKNSLKKDGKLICILSNILELGLIFSSFKDESKRIYMEKILKENFTIFNEEIVKTNYIFPNIDLAAEDTVFLLETFYKQENVNKDFI